MSRSAAAYTAPLAGQCMVSPLNPSLPHPLLTDLQTMSVEVILLRFLRLILFHPPRRSKLLLAVAAVSLSWASADS